MQCLQGIGENANHLLTLISQILDLSKVEAGRMKVKLKEVDLDQLIREVVDNSAPIAKERPYQICYPRPDKPLRVNTDPILVRQILINLLSNAVKFTAEGSVTVSLEVEGSHEIQIHVKDTGIGIRPEHLAMIFDEFRQVDGSSTREHGGTGLGLAISKKFATLLRGTILVTSTYGKGSCFTLALKQPSLQSEAEEHLIPERAVTMGESDVSQK
jgi:signal transduction histidine kinase